MPLSWWQLKVQSQVQRSMQSPPTCTQTSIIWWIVIRDGSLVAPQDALNSCRLVFCCLSIGHKCVQYFNDGPNDPVSPAGEGDRLEHCRDLRANADLFDPACFSFPRDRLSFDVSFVSHRWLFNRVMFVGFVVQVLWSKHLNWTLPGSGAAAKLIWLEVQEADSNTCLEFVESAFSSIEDLLGRVMESSEFRRFHRGNSSLNIESCCCC